VTSLSEEHKRALASRLQRINNLLRDLACRINPGGLGSLFEEVVGWNDEQHRLFNDRIVEIQALMKTIIESKGLNEFRSTISAHWLMRNGASVMLSVADDLRPERLKGYGELTEEACQEMNEIVLALQQQLITLLQNIKRKTIQKGDDK